MHNKMLIGACLITLTTCLIQGCGIKKSVVLTPSEIVKNTDTEVSYLVDSIGCSEEESNSILEDFKLAINEYNLEVEDIRILEKDQDIVIEVYDISEKQYVLYIDKDMHLYTVKEGGVDGDIVFSDVN